MQRLRHKQILLGVTGGIAAYKACEIIRRLRDAQAEVRVVMTPAACEFITPLTLQALSGNPVHTTLLDPEAEAGMGHIELARWADMILIAPGTADVMARLASGMGDDLLTTLCLASTAPLVLCPAMNQAMWKDPATQDNLQKLLARGARTIGPAEGFQACGDVGPGRMSDPEVIVTELARHFDTGVLEGLQVVITAGPTRESIDPVRYISNHSSGKMGFALAEAAAEAGASVTLVAGPVSLPTPARVRRVNVQSALDMLAATQAACKAADIFIASAAVADYRPKTLATHKIKKPHDESKVEMTIELTRNPDILATIARQAERPWCVGFAAETQHLIKHARQKLEKKNIELIIANDVANPAIGFNSDENEITAISRAFARRFKRMPKRQLARHLVELIARLRSDE
jgi:phosphopantothenoylcysteine decarboxylase/phosphopantothenate--cysteine ligase